MRLPDDCVYEQDLRRCLFYLNYLNDKKIKVFCESNAPASICDSINEKIFSLIKEPSERVKFIKEMKSECDNSLVKLESFKWLIDNERAAYWFWFLFIEPKQIVVNIPSSSSPLTIPYIFTPPRSIRYLSVDSSHQTRINAIINYFEQWSVDNIIDSKLFAQGISTAIIKTQIINQLKIRWSDIFTQKDPFGFIKIRNDESLSWAWQYMKKYKYNLFNFMDIAPVSKKDYELALYCAWDTAYDQDGGIGKRYFLSELKKAWGQKKFRDNSKGTRVVNTRIPEHVKRKLDFLVDERKTSIADMISQLIEQEYNNHSKK
ncbi:MAG: hypothetical protein LBN41_01280 [Enterobacteriaceae bacterium]|jgi:hypothetical protein|nr:hypothetical protein [Enterobacteriaceae bacterium]